MSKVSNSIGLKFERFLGGRFPDLIDMGNGLLVPDFHCPDYGFWLEAKVGNILWGSRIKEYQIAVFDQIRTPVMYALGFHTFHHAHKRLTQKTERGRQAHLDRYMVIPQICFITSDFMRLLWEKEQRVSKKKELTYCMMKNSTLNNVFLNRKFKRYNQQVWPESYYNFSYADYNLVETREENGRYWRGIFDPKKDSGFVKCDILPTLKVFLLRQKNPLRGVGLPMDKLHFSIIQTVP